MKGANLIISESNIEIITEADQDKIRFSIENIGNSEARDIKYQVFSIHFHDDINNNAWLNRAKLEEILFNEMPINSIPPKKTMFAGQIITKHKIEIESREVKEIPPLEIEGANMALIFYIQYSDSFFPLLNRDKENKYYYYYRLAKNKSVISLRQKHWEIIEARFNRLLAEQSNLLK